MEQREQETWRGWKIEVWEQKEQCANFSFAVLSPEGTRHEVKMGGENRKRAIERAKEWIDMELALINEETQ